jgi:hypothetical protein
MGKMLSCDSPAYFCAASETARDSAEKLAEASEGATRAPTRWLPDPTTGLAIGQRTHSRRTRTRQRSLGSWRSYGPIGPGPRSPSGSILVGTGSYTLGCMTDVGEGWTMEMLEAASEKRKGFAPVSHGAGRSGTDPELHVRLPGNGSFEKEFWTSS